MSAAIRKALLPSSVMALVAAPIFGTPETITLVILSIAGFISAMVVLVAFWRLSPVPSWARWKQRLATWLIVPLAGRSWAAVSWWLLPLSGDDASVQPLGAGDAGFRLAV